MDLLAGERLPNPPPPSPPHTPFPCPPSTNIYAQLSGHLLASYCDADFPICPVGHVRCTPDATGIHTGKLLKPQASVVCMTISGLIPLHLLQQLLIQSSGFGDSLLCLFTEH